MTTTRASETSQEKADDYYVIQVRRSHEPYDTKGPCRAGLGDSIIVDVWNLEGWLSSADLRAKLGRVAEIRELVPYFNGLPIPGCHPDVVTRSEHMVYEGRDGTTTHIHFVLKRDDASREAWGKLLNQPVLTRQLGVSVGFESGEELATDVFRDTTFPRKQFFLVLMRPSMLAAGALTIVLSLVLFIHLVGRTDIIRDQGPRRPDGRRPFSLARTQMAIWFFLVIASYFFLWLVTGAYDTITPSVLGLVGISAGTALGAAVVDAGKRVEDDAFSETAATRSARTIRLGLQQELAEAKSRLASHDEARTLIPATDQAKLAENQKLREASEAEVADLAHRLEYFRWPTWKRVMYDLLSDNQMISFHRFQIFVWTIVLGIIFCVKVYNELSMPEFSGTLLALMGISAGTYIGFKIPESASPKARGSD